MNFKEAYQKMQEGKKVRRKGWEGLQYYSLIEDNIFFVGKLIVPNITVEDALAEDWEVVEETKSKVKVWKPNKNEKFCYIGGDGDIYHTVNVNLTADDCIFSIGNFFKTDEEAEHMVEKLKVIRELQDLSNIKFNMSDYVKNNGIYYIAYDFTQNRIVPLFDNISRNIPFNVYFSTKEDCEKAITKIGKERLERYYFDMED